MLRPEGESLWRRVAELVPFAAGQDLLEVGCGSGEALCVWAGEFGVDGTGAEVDPEQVAAAEERAREESLQDRIRFQVAGPEDLPFRDGSFDVAVGGITLGDLADPRGALAELVRVTRVNGTVVLLQWAWAARVSAAKQEVFQRLLETPARSPQEWQRLLAAEGVGDLHCDTIWEVDVPLPSAGLRDRLGGARNARGVRGLRGLARSVRSEREARRLIGRGHLLGVAMIKGTKWP